MQWKNIPRFAANLVCAIFCADFLTMLSMNTLRLSTHWLPVVFFSLLGIAGFSIFRSSLIPNRNPGYFSENERRYLTLLVLIVGLVFACMRIPYLLEGHLHHLVGPIVYDDTWHFQEINSLVNSARYPAHCSLIPSRYFSFYYAPWMMIAAIYLAIPVDGFTIKAAFAIGCGIYQILICLALLYIGISKAKSRQHLYWALYLIGCWAGIESFFSAMYYLRRNIWWMRISDTPIHFPTFEAGIVWAVHHVSAAAALIFCWYIWDTAGKKRWKAVLACSVLIGYAIYSSVFVFLGALAFGIFIAIRNLHEHWKSMGAIAGLTSAMVWPLLWIFLGKSNDIRFIFPFIREFGDLFPFAASLNTFSAQNSPHVSHWILGMWPTFVLFLIFLCLNFLPHMLALVFYGKGLSKSNRILIAIALAFLVSTYFIGFPEGDNYASRGYVVPILALGWICAGLLPSIHRRKWIAIALFLGAFGSLHECVQTYKHAISFSRALQAGKHDREILTINRTRTRAFPMTEAIKENPSLIYDIEKFVPGGKRDTVTADRQLECLGPRGPWRWQQIPDVSEKK